MAMTKNSENWLFGGKKSPCGVVPQQNKGCKHIPDYSRPNSDQIISKSNDFYIKFIENRWFSIKTAEKIEIVMKLEIPIPIPMGMSQKLIVRDSDSDSDYLPKVRS